MTGRELTSIDRLFHHFDQGLRVLFGGVPHSTRPHPDSHIAGTSLTQSEQRRTCALMRVNHSGEVCAQALYQGQAIAARNDEVVQCMQQAAVEENDHLAWCHSRLQALGGHTSYLNVFWYSGALMIGISAGLMGDKVSLGFLAETERQVVAHLKSHLQRLSPNDIRSRAIISQMIIDESQHATTALNHGARKLSRPTRWVMHQSAKIMTTIAYYI